MSKLDWNLPYGQVYGTGSKARYYQDNKPFDGVGNEIVETKKAVKPVVATALLDGVTNEGAIFSQSFDWNENWFSLLKKLKAAGFTGKSKADAKAWADKP